MRCWISSIRFLWRTRQERFLRGRPEAVGCQWEVESVDRKTPYSAICQTVCFCSSDSWGKPWLVTVSMSIEWIDGATSYTANTHLSVMR